MEPKLKPIEKPGLIMRLAYLYSKFLYGKVISPLKIAYARLPVSFMLFAGKISRLEKRTKLPEELILLIRHHIAQINTCSFCMDIGIAISLKGKIHSDKFYHLHEFKNSHLYSPEEKVALEFAEELTVTKKIKEETFTALSNYFSERQMVEIAWVVSTENYYNLMNMAFDIPSDGLCELRKEYSTK